MSAVYRPFDQDRHLGPPPWSGDDPAVQGWEDAHGHDVRLKCYPEFGCQAIEYERQAMEEVVGAVRAHLVLGPQDDSPSRFALESALARLDGEEPS